MRLGKPGESGTCLAHLESVGLGLDLDDGKVR